MEEERRISQMLLGHEETGACRHGLNAGKPLLKMLLCDSHRFFRGLRLGRDEGRAALEIIERDTFPDDVSKEILALRKGTIDLIQRVANEIDRGPDAFVVHQPVLGAVPVSGKVNDALLVDHNQKVIMTEITFGRMRLVHPVAARIRAEEDDLEDPAILFFRRRGAFHRIGKLGKENIRHAFEFALFSVWEVIEIGSHLRHLKQVRAP